jgi:hypothetical protein
MHQSASPIWDAWSEISTRLPSDLDDLAVATKAIVRLRQDGISDGETLLRLCLARGPGGKSLSETAAWALLNGVADLTGQSINERLHRSVAFLSTVVQRLLTGRAGGKPAIWTGRCLRIADGSSLSQRASKGTDWRVHGVYDLDGGGFSHLEVTDTKGAESLLRCAPVTNEVLIADRGYARAKELRACAEPGGANARDFIVRAGWRSLALRDPAGDAFDIIAHLEKLAAGSDPAEWSVQAVVDARKPDDLLALRLVVVPLPADKAEAAREKRRRYARKHGEAVDPRSIVAAGFMILTTSLPPDIPAQEIYAAYRLRWQIELAFKRMKSLIHIDQLPTRTAAGGLCWLYAHLILTLLTEDICQDFLESSP